MPKQKSHSGTKKRVRRTGSGKMVMKRSRKNHLLQQKSKRQKKLPRTLSLENAVEEKKLRTLAPYT